MGWKLVQSDDDDGLTNAELIGISILMRHNSGEPQDDRNVYFRAWEKIQTAVDIAIEESERE